MFSKYLKGLRIFLHNCVLKEGREEDQPNVSRKREAWGYHITGVILQLFIYSGMKKLQERTGHLKQQQVSSHPSIMVQSRKSIATSNSTVISTTKSIHRAKLHKNVCLLPFLLGGNQEYVYSWAEGRAHNCAAASLVQTGKGKLTFCLINLFYPQYHFSLPPKIYLNCLQINKVAEVRKNF